MSFQEIPPLQSFDPFLDLQGIVSRAEGLLYTLADAAVVADPSSATAANDAAQKNGGWFGFISEAMEVVLKVVHSLILAFKGFLFIALWSLLDFHPWANQYFEIHLCNSFYVQYFYMRNGIFFFFLGDINSWF